MSNDMIHDRAASPAKSLPLAKGKLINETRDKAIAHVKIQRPVLDIRSVGIAERIVVLRSKIGAAGVPQGLAVGVVHDQRQTMGQAMLQGELQGVVVGISTRLQIADRCSRRRKTDAAARRPPKDRPTELLDSD